MDQGEWDGILHLHSTEFVSMYELATLWYTLCNKNVFLYPSNWNGKIKLVKENRVLISRKIIKRRSIRTLSTCFQRVEWYPRSIKEQLLDYVVRVKK
jgi:hypothetical protein